MPELGNKFRSAIAGEMIWSTVLSKDMDEEESCELRCVNFVGCWYKDGLFGELIYNNKYCGETIGGWKLLDKVH